MSGQREGTPDGEALIVGNGFRIETNTVHDVSKIQNEKKSVIPTGKSSF